MTPASGPNTPALGVVIIGRNEGERLRRCIESVQTQGSFPTVYVDSGSTDGSVALARSLGVNVVELDPARPFTAARGRNEGFRWLRAHHPQLEFVQFLDGDTEVQPGWIERATDALLSAPDVAAVAGRRRERHPEQSVYNLLCDIEWDTPVGDAEAFGGDVLLRTDDVDAVNGYDETLIAGEDPDLSVRLREAGRRILRVDAEMTLHDAALTHFAQWWKRTVRAGHAYAEGAARHRAIGFWQREVRSNWLWGAALPGIGALTLVPSLGTSIFVVSGGYATLFVKVRRDARRRGMPTERATAYAGFVTLAKVPQALGQARYWWGRVARRRSGLIEYK